MLVDLRVKNFALIDELEINFKKGLNVLTGETGAGKSIIIGALDMLLGARASTDVIRKEKETAYIEAVYEPQELEKINQLLEQAGIEPDSEILLLSREIRLNKRNRSRINGQLATLRMIKNISKYLVDIHGQHEHQSLLDSSLHLQLLDDYIGEEIKELKGDVIDIYKEIRKIENKLSEMRVDESEKARQIDLLEFQIDEIEQAQLKPGELEELKNKYNKLSNMEEIFSVTGEIYNRLNGEDFNNQGLVDRFGHFMKEIESIKEYDNQLDNFYKQIQDIFYQLQDLGFQIRDYHEELEFNKAQLKKIEERLDLIHGLQKKYGETIEKIISYQQQLIKKKDKLVARDKLIEELNEKKQKLEEKYYDQADKLSSIRKDRAEEFEEQIMVEFDDLAMEDTIFEVKFKERKPARDGTDQIEFLISTNPGEELKPLVKIASGGELSRIMLALKTLIADIDMVDTLIFDEVDSGVGGKTAQKMAEKLTMISQRRQVICITHLPQIASMSDNHFFITKKTEAERTFTMIYSLDKKGQKEELARMLGGVKMTNTTLKHAEEMLKLAEDKKIKLSG